MSSFEPTEAVESMPSTPPVPATLQIKFNAAVAAVMRICATFGARQRAGSEGRPEWGKRARPRWFGAQGAESGHEERIFSSPQPRRDKK
ncbi:hypothetical protein [Pollutimonas bauzanensis]|jgi:hypothetical protein|uniref:hypothetical protein n=1 Tax=Pollutimonas bauzanensis TaxID=658167 RepID=UPI0033422F00